jgi:regulation of enolase protein 1 (concanavalin A-like superfamily)
MTDIDWTSGTWTTTPAHVDIAADGMRVTALEESDAWRITSYGFIHDTEHALLVPFEQDTAMEVSFHLDFSAQFDQAGIFVKIDDTTWIKTGIERSDGEDSVGAVVTRDVSDWSLSPVPGWHGRQITMRVSRSGDALTIRARADNEPWRLVRVAPLDPHAQVKAGPLCCAPSRDDLTVHFTSWRTTAADTSLHPED